MKKLLSLLFVVPVNLCAITVHNMTDTVLYGAPYYYDSYRALQQSAPKTIAPKRSAQFARPAFSIGKERMFLFSQDRGALRRALSSSQYNLLPKVSIGVGQDFYLSLSQGRYKGLNTVQWSLIEPIKKEVTQVAKKVTEKPVEAARSEFFNKAEFPFLPQKPDQVKLRNVSHSRIPLLAPQELAFIQARNPRVNTALRHMTGQAIRLDQTPVITLAGSGGGYRAMLSMVGFLRGAQEIGLLDVTMYISALSGSTWTLGPWYSSGWSLEEFQKRLLPKVAKDLLDVTPNMPDMAAHLFKRKVFSQPVTFVNLYGVILGNKLLADLPGGPFKIYVHDQHEVIKKGERPMPIYTAVTTKLPYQWVEFTPYEVGSDYLGGYIPMWSFGAPFEQGTMKYFTPPYALDFVLAICGVAFAARLHTIIEHTTKRLPDAVKNLIQSSFVDETKEIARFRLSSGEVFNWTAGVRPLPRAQQKILKLIDGGIHYNFGLEALYRRKPQVIIIGDFSDSSPGHDLEQAVNSLKERGFKVPPIDYTDLDKKHVAVFKDPKDRSVPVIIYFPFTAVEQGGFNPQDCLDGMCSTMKFQYSQQDALKLIDRSKDAVVKAKPEIVKVLKEVIAR